MDDDPIGQIKTAAEALGALIEAAGDSSEVKEAGKELGKTALTIAKSINVILLPLAAVNFAYDKAKEYFSSSGKFEKEFANVTADIPLENLIEPKPSIAGPVLQGLSFTTEEDNLREMYLRLLATSMDGRVSSGVHPSFSEIIKQLNSEEASLLKCLIVEKTGAPIVKFTQRVKTGGYRSVISHIGDVIDAGTGKPAECKMFSTYVDNWVRLGIMDASYTQYKMGENSYSWVEARPEYERYKAMFEKEDTFISIDKGILLPTMLGQQFAEAVGIYTPASSLAAS